MKHTIVAAIESLRARGTTVCYLSAMKTEIDLLAEALQRLDQHYRERDKFLESHLNGLAAELERLAKNVNGLNAQVSTLAAQLSRFQDVLPK